MKATDRSRLSYFEAIVEAFDGMVYVCSPDNHIEFVNRQVTEQLGRDPVGSIHDTETHPTSQKTADFNC